MKKTTEEALQSAIVLHWNANHFNDGIIAAIPNEYARGRSVPGLFNGFSDLILVSHKPKIIFIELKVGKNKQTKWQKLFEKIVTRLGWNYYLCYSLEEFKDIIKLEFNK